MRKVAEGQCWMTRQASAFELPMMVDLLQKYW